MTKPILDSPPFPSSIQNPKSKIQNHLLWLSAFAFLGIVLVFLYPDADQQDAGYHYLFARWSWKEPYYLIGVWTRPLFTLIYSIPAQLGYSASKLFTLVICLVTGLQTFRLARRLSLPNAELVVPLLFLQPAYFLLFTETQTEPLFALLFVVALRLHYEGRVRAGMIVASLLILVRPEGFFLGFLWWVWVLQSHREWRWWRRLSESMWLGTGALAWWLAASLITGDPLWILHDWPADWHALSIANGRGPLFWYLLLLPLIVGPLLIPAFVIGVKRLVDERVFALGVSAVLTLLLLHSVLFWRGWFGGAGYARYIVCVAPATAIISLAGWNQLAVMSRRGVRVTVLAASFLICLFYVDGYRFTRDARAVDEVMRWLDQNPVAFTRLVYSQSYMCIRLKCGDSDSPQLNADREHNLDLMRRLSAGTLVFWDAEVGPKWYKLEAGDFERLGYRRLLSRSFRLEGWFFRIPWRYHGGPRYQEMHLFYK